jgi:hypothetical protein
MRLHSRAFLTTAAIATILSAAGTPLLAQWLNYPVKGIPRLPDGKANLSAPAPKTPEGKPDLSGVWLVAPGSVANIAKDLMPDDAPFQPWARKLFEERRATESKDDPTGYCIPGGVPRSGLVGYPFKVAQLPGMVAILYEAVHSFRQIFLDGRALSGDPNPTWMGYSVGHWDGDALVVETAGFNDHGWLDNGGRPSTDALRVTERFRRKDFGHMDIQITVDDSKAYTKPWTVTTPLTLQPDGELLEYVCGENNKDIEHLVGK